jgi:hypothetical protein
VLENNSTSLSPSFLRTTAAMKARTVCGCQPVERVTVAMVAPLGPHSSASRKSPRIFKRIICDDVSEFESHMPSHAVGLSQVRSPAIVMHRVALDYGH